MKDGSQKKHKNDFRVRLYDIEVVKSIEELMDTSDFESANELLGRAIAIGVEKIYLEYGKRKRIAQAIPNPEMPETVRLDRIEHAIAKLRVLQEDMYIVMNSVEALTASIYNVHRANVRGEALNEELMDNYGYMSELPEAYREIKNNLLKRFNRRVGIKSDGKPE